MTINDLRKGRNSMIGQDYFVTFTTKKRSPVCIDHNVATIIAKIIHYHHHALRKEEARIDFARYIVAKPLRSGLGTNVADYPWWNANYL